MDRQNYVSFPNGPTVGDVVNEVAGLSQHDLTHVIAAARALRDNKGYVTPAEEFINQVLIAYSLIGPMMEPEWIEPDLKAFKENRADVEGIVRRYAAILEEKAPAESEETTK